MTEEQVTLRDYFAAKALQALITVECDPGQRTITNAIARAAYMYADAMLEEREDK